MCVSLWNPLPKLPCLSIYTVTQEVLNRSLCEIWYWRVYRKLWSHIIFCLNWIVLITILCEYVPAFVHVGFCIPVLHMCRVWVPHCPYLCSACYAQAKKIKSGIHFKFWVPKIEIFATVTKCFCMSSGINATIVWSAVARICRVSAL